MSKVHFLDKAGTFEIKNPENYSGLYFPIASEMGMKSAVASNFGGDNKLNQNTFVLEPVSIDNLHNNRSTRNFWCVTEDETWSAVGQSAQQEAEKFTDKQDESTLVAGLMWQQVVRTSKNLKLEAAVTSFVPVDANVEIMQVTIKNTGDDAVTFTPVAAIPIYGRSADNIRDHRHVTSLLHRIRTTAHGVYVKPTLSFDERGHQKNTLTYYVCGVADEKKQPIGYFPVAADYIGDGGTFIRPLSLMKIASAMKNDTSIDKMALANEEFAGQEAMGGIVFEKTTLSSGEEASYTVLIGVCENTDEIEKLIARFETKECVENELATVKDYWQKQVNVSYHSKDADFDNYMRWVSFQPFLRRIYGCSFLPHHDYGKGGRGWRDLWQDCLALLMMNPDGVRQMIIDNYGGVRVDGSNATIIGSRQGEFIADRNNITRVWMDHGLWPFMTTKFYIDQTGDIDILNQQVTYFKDRQGERGTSVDEEWTPEYGNRQKDSSENVYSGTILEHLLLQHLCSFYEVGGHNHIRLRGADWNDALDMADENGESVAFTCAYAGNLKQLAAYIRLLKELCNVEKLEIMEEISILLNGDEAIYNDIDKKLSVLNEFASKCRHAVSGRKISLDIEAVADNLDKKADWMMEHIRKTEWVSDSDGRGWFNSYYDNHGNQVEGEFESGIRMMLTGQVFALMSKTATKEQMQQVADSVKKYLFDEKIGGYRINTDFKEEKYDMGRMFGFAYGEKENGAVFSHMAVMYANALYQNGFVKEAYEALMALYETSMRFETSRMYPGIPEYFNNEGRGLYSYLTGAASWYMMTVITEAYGIRGELGKLSLEPKLVAAQFDNQDMVSLDMNFAGTHINVIYHNPQKLTYGEYRIVSTSDSRIPVSDECSKVIVEREWIKENDEYSITIELGK